MSDILPIERRVAEDGRQLLQSASRLVATTYTELGRYQDGDRESADRAHETLNAAMSALESARDLMQHLSQPRTPHKRGPGAGNPELGQGWGAMARPGIA